MTCKITLVSASLVMWQRPTFHLLNSGTIKLGQLTYDIELPRWSTIFILPWHTEWNSVCAERHVNHWDWVTEGVFCKVNITLRKYPQWSLELNYSYYIVCYPKWLETVCDLWWESQWSWLQPDNDAILSHYHGILCYSHKPIPPCVFCKAWTWTGFLFGGRRAASSLAWILEVQVCWPLLKGLQAWRPCPLVWGK